MLGTIYYRKRVFILATYYNYKSIEELNKYAKKYNTTPPSFLAELGKNTLGTYTIPEDSVESFNNIISFLLHSTLKDSHLLDDADNAISKTFKDLLIKYYENELSDDDIYMLLYLVKTYNDEIDAIFENNDANVIFSLDKENISNADYFNNIVNKIIQNDKYLVNVTDGKVSDTQSSTDIQEKTLFKTPLNDFLLAISLDNNEFKSFIEAIVYIYICNKLDSIPEETKNDVSIENVPKEIALFGNELNTSDKYYIKEENKYYNVKTGITYKYKKITNKGMDSGFFILTDKIERRIVFKSSENSKQLYILENSIYEQTDAYLETTETSFNLDIVISNPFEVLLNADKLDIDSFIEYISIANLGIEKYKDISKRKEKILVSNSASNITYIGEKRGASPEEAYRTRIFDNVCPFNLLNVSVDPNSDIVTIYNEIFKDNQAVANGARISDPISISFAVIYKELNPEYRKAELSDVIDFGIALKDDDSLFPGSGELITSLSIDLMLKNLVAEYSKDDIFKMLRTIKTNPYYARKARESDIIQYVSGTYEDYDYGDAVSTENNKYIENKEIELFMEIYQETRDYYYARLLNKSFVHDDFYNSFEKFFIAFYAVERFISAKIDVIHDIDHFDSTDISNFLKSYGLDVLDASATFYNQDLYKLNIIKEFKNLIKNKGTSKVTEYLMKIFNGKNSEIKINKYLLAEISGSSSDATADDNYNVTDSTKNDFFYSYYNDSSKTEYDTTNYTYNNGIITSKDGEVVGHYYPKKEYKTDKNIKFIEVDYNTDNETKDILKAISNQKDYKTFVEDDPYWDENLLTEEDIKKLNINTVASKYTSFEYSQDTAKAVIKAIYSLELMEYLYEKLKYTNGEKIETITKNIVFTFTGTDNLSNLSFDDVFRVLRLMFKGVIFAKTAKTGGITKAYLNNFMTINREANLNTFVTNLTEYIKANPTLNTSLKYLSNSDWLKKDGKKVIYTGEDSYITILQNVFSNMDYSRSQKDLKFKTSFNLIDEYLKDVNLLSMLNQDVDIIKFINVHKGIDETKLKNDNATLVENIIDPILEFPYDHLAANGNPEFKVEYEAAYLNTDFKIFTNILYETFYTDNGNNVITYDDKITNAADIAMLADNNFASYIFGNICDYSESVVKNEKNKDIKVGILSAKNHTADDEAAQIEKIISIGNILTNLYSFLNVNFQIDSTMENTTKFLMAALRMFISYTSDITSVKSVSKYELDGENVIPTDYYSSSTSADYVDSIFYDESVEYILNTNEGDDAND